MQVVLKLNSHRLDHLAPLFQALCNHFPDGDIQFEQESSAYNSNEQELCLVVDLQSHTILSEDYTFLDGLLKQHLLSFWFRRGEDYSIKTKSGHINQFAFTLVKPQLEMAGPTLNLSTPSFTAEFQAYLADPTDPTGLRLSHLREMAQSFQQTFTLIIHLLTWIETPPRTS